MAPKLLSPFSQFLLGASAPLRGFSILRRNLRHLGPLCVLPVMITAMTFIAVVAGTVYGIYLIDISSYTPTWMPGFLLGTFVFMGKLLLGTAVVLLSYLVFTPIGLALATPINDVISARVEKILLGERYEPLPGLSIWTGILHTSQHLAVTLTFGIPLAILAILPFINLVFFWPNLLFGSLVLSLEFIDIPLSKRVFRYFQKWSYLSKHPLYCLGFGVVCFFMMAIPIVNLALMPLNIIGGTWLYLKMEGKLNAPREDY